MKGYGKLCQKMVALLVYHFVWGHLGVLKDVTCVRFAKKCNKQQSLMDIKEPRVLLSKNEFEPKMSKTSQRVHSIYELVHNGNVFHVFWQHFSHHPHLFLHRREDHMVRVNHTLGHLRIIRHLHEIQPGTITTNHQTALLLLVSKVYLRQEIRFHCSWAV